MVTPAMQIKTAAILVIFTESWPRRAPKKRVKRPDMEFRTVVLATLVFASAMFAKYCRYQSSTRNIMSGTSSKLMIMHEYKKNLFFVLICFWRGRW